MYFTKYPLKASFLYFYSVDHEEIETMKKDLYFSLPIFFCA